MTPLPHLPHVTTLPGVLGPNLPLPTQTHPHVGSSGSLVNAANGSGFCRHPGGLGAEEVVVILCEPEEDTDGDPVESWDVAEQPLHQKTVETWSPATR